MRSTLVSKYELMDGRAILVKIVGNNYPDTYEDQGGFDPDEDDPMTLTWDDSNEELSDEEYEEYGEVCFDHAMDHGTFEDEDEDDYGEYDDIDLTYRLEEPPVLSPDEIAEGKRRFGKSYGREQEEIPPFTNPLSREEEVWIEEAILHAFGAYPMEEDEDED